MENKVEIFKTSNGAEVAVKLENDTVWLDAHTIASIFGVNRPAIVKHIGNIYKVGELEEKATCSKMEQVASDGKRRVIIMFIFAMQKKILLHISENTAGMGNKTNKLIRMYRQ